MKCEACGEDGGTWATRIPQLQGHSVAYLCKGCAEAWAGIESDEFQHHMWRIRLRRGLEKGVMK